MTKTSGSHHDRFDSNSFAVRPSSSIVKIYGRGDHPRANVKIERAMSPSRIIVGPLISDQVSTRAAVQTVAAAAVNNGSPPIEWRSQANDATSRR